MGVVSQPRCRMPVRLTRECYQMQKTIETHLPHLSQPQLTGLVLWVCGAILAGSACQSAVASALLPWGRRNSRRQYLREWLYDGSDRARPCQTELDVIAASRPCCGGFSSGSTPDAWPWPLTPRSKATRPRPSSSACSTVVAPSPGLGASITPPSAAPGWTPPWNCSGNWPQRFPGI